MESKKVVLVNIADDLVEKLKQQLLKEKFEVVLLDGKDTLVLDKINMHRDAVVVGDAMGVSSSLEFCRQLSLHQRADASPLIMMMELDNEVDEIVALELGVDALLKKQASGKLVAAHIRSIKKRLKHKASRREIKIANLDMDKLSRIVRVDQKEIDLSLKEFNILWMLAKRLGESVPRNDIIKEVWGANIYVEQRTIDVHISVLRSKVKKEGLSLKIKTVRGVGYRLVPV